MIEDSEIIAAMEKHKSQRKAAAALGVTKTVVQRRMAKLATKGHLPGLGIGVEIPDPFYLERLSVNQNLKTGEFTQVWHKLKVDDVKRAQMMEAFIAAMTKEMPRAPKIKHSGCKVDSSRMATYIFGDPHFGMYSWGDETGGNWDLEIAERVHCEAMDYLVDMAPNTETAVVVNLGDLAHYDSIEPKTPASGHIVDADSRFDKMLEVSFRSLRRMIEGALVKHKFVHVLSIPGNHDETTGKAITKMIAIAYENNPRVTVDTTPSLFKYYRWENNFIGVHHGHKCKPAGLPAVMQNDRRKDFAATDNHFWHVGHFHHADRKEYSDCIVEVHQTLAAADAYAHNGGWRSKRSAVCVVYDKQYGECGRLYAFADQFKQV